MVTIRQAQPVLGTQLSQLSPSTVWVVGIKPMLSDSAAGPFTHRAISLASFIYFSCITMLKAWQHILLMSTPGMRRQESKMILGFLSEDLELFFSGMETESISEGQERQEMLRGQGAHLSSVGCTALCFGVAVWAGSLTLRVIQCLRSSQNKRQRAGPRPDHGMPQCLQLERWEKEWSERWGRMCPSEKCVRRAKDVVICHL